MKRIKGLHGWYLILNRKSVQSFNPLHP